MDAPRLYERYERREAIALLGGEEGSRSLCRDQWVIHPRAVLGFVEVGDPPQMSHFTGGGEFCWVARDAYRVNGDKDLEFVPPEVVSGHADRPIQLFVSPSHSGPYRYVGRLGPACRFRLGDRTNFGEATFELSPALPSEVWIQLGGPRPGDLDHEAVDTALAGLRDHADIEGRLRVLRRLVEYWHGPIGPGDGIPEDELEGLALPHPLRRWYRWAGRRPGLLDGQNTLLGPAKLIVEDGLLVFYGENQWCYEWATSPSGDDPPVFGREDDADPWEPEGITLSEHLILACLFEGIMRHCPYGASASWLGGPALDRIVERIPPIPIGPWRWGTSSRFHARSGAFMYTMSNGEIDGEPGYSVWIGAKTEHPLQPVKPLVDERWEIVAF